MDPLKNDVLDAAGKFRLSACCDAHPADFPVAANVPLLPVVELQRAQSLHALGQPIPFLFFVVRNGFIDPLCPSPIYDGGNHLQQAAPQQDHGYPGISPAHQENASYDHGDALHGVRQYFLVVVRDSAAILIQPRLHFSGGSRQQAEAQDPLLLKRPKILTLHRADAFVLLRQSEASEAPYGHRGAEQPCQPGHRPEVRRHGALKQLRGQPGAAKRASGTKQPIGAAHDQRFPEYSANRSIHSFASFS